MFSATIIIPSDDPNITAKIQMIAEEIAKASDVPVRTVHGWAEAFERPVGQSSAIELF